MMREEDDEETLFDQHGLLGSGRKSSWDGEWIRRFAKTSALSLGFFALVSVFHYIELVSISVSCHFISVFVYCSLSLSPLPPFLFNILSFYLSLSLMCHGRLKD